MTDTAIRTTTSTWTIDPTHSVLEFAVKHMMFTTAKGRFQDFAGTIVFNEQNVEKSSVEVAIQTASITTNTEDRDAHLRSADFFDAERVPQIAFRSKRIDGSAPKGEGDRFRLVGDLTIRDSTMEVVLDCEYQGRGTDPWGKTRAGFTFRTELDRQEWGLRWNQALETGGVLVANRVRIEGEVQFVRDGE